MLNGFPILNIFPELLSFSFLAPMFLRLTLGAIAVNLGHLALTSEKERTKLFFEGFGISAKKEAAMVFGIIEIIGGILLIFGLYTQAAALLFVLIMFIEGYAEYKERALVQRTIVFYVLLFAIALSLLFTGAGAYSLDLPL